MENNETETKNENKKDIVNLYWKRIDEINNFVINFTVLYGYKNILDIGAGKNPFILANKIIDYNTKYDLNGNNSVQIFNGLDIDINKLPFENKSIDFVYSRYTLQEIQNPDFVMNEIFRITNSGYIETPSPLIEITKGIDNTNNMNNYYAGYIHHRYIIWSDNEKCEIYFLPKYNSILDNIMTLNVDKNLYENRYYWNNYFIWKDKELNKEPKVIIYKKDINFGFDNFIKEYLELIFTAVNKSIENTERFLSKYKATKYKY